MDKTEKCDYLDPNPKNLNICLVVPWISSVSITFLLSLKSIISVSVNHVTIIAGGDKSFLENISEDDFWKLYHKSSQRFIERILNYVYLELRFLRKGFELRNQIDIWIFYKGGECLLLLNLFLKFILKRKIIMILAGSVENELAIRGDRFCSIIYFIKRLNCRLADKIILYSPSLIKEWNLELYLDKIHLAARHYIDLDLFNLKCTLESRPGKIGFFGRLSEEKGILNFVQALPGILCKKKDIEVIIGGEGYLSSVISDYIHEHQLSNHVKLLGWIPNDQLPRYLNDIRLLVLPSYTEGLPNIILESMACGTPVLATPVGSIPDIIIDGQTGFIMTGNSPKCIEDNVIRALNYPLIEQIIENAINLIKNEFTHKCAADKYRQIFNFKK